MFKYKQNLVYFQVVLLFSYIELTLINNLFRFHGT